DGPERREKVHLPPDGCNEGQAFRIRDNFGMRGDLYGGFCLLAFPPSCRPSTLYNGEFDPGSG
ncbi:hypothetical protein, partial [Segatella buccae]|uniref:hypothetical protein n=1 Tax=Segatella buccae TaxID=28126 RepID=UPI0022E778AE